MMNTFSFLDVSFKAPSLLSGNLYGWFSSAFVVFCSSSGGGNTQSNSWDGLTIKMRIFSWTFSEASLIFRGAGLNPCTRIGPTTLWCHCMCMTE